MTMYSVSTVFRMGGGLVLASMLAGCLGSGGGGGAGGGGAGGGGGGAGGSGTPVTMAEYDANLQRVRGMIPTSDMQTTGTAGFSGATKLDMTQGGTGHVIGDVHIDVDFAAENDKAITGTATNWRGTVDGQDVAYSGTLSTGNRFPSAFMNDDQALTLPPGVPLPPGAPTTTRPGSASIAMYGNIDDAAAGDSLVLLTMGGGFVGPQGQAIHGPAQIQQITGTSIAERAGAGTFYLERD